MSFSSPVWHPFTQHAMEPVTRIATYAEGAHLYDNSGQAILDAISSWWVITHQHRHPAIVAAITEAATKLDQVIFAEFTHEAAEKLARGLLDFSPTGLTRVFYSDSGSTAVEVGIKMALGFFYHKGIPRHRIAVLDHSYHGDTVGTMSAGERGIFTAAYRSLLFDVVRLPFPEIGKEQNVFDTFELACQKKDIAALLIEPLVLGAGGMRIYAPSILTTLDAIARRYDVLVIADEVMTGWGRTGTIFACEQAKISPTILCTAKGLTGGTLPLAATLCKEEIFAAHYAKDPKRTFFHSSSYTANPIACAAAVANIKIWQQEPVKARLDQLANLHRERLAPFTKNLHFSAVRQLGTIAALDLKVEEDDGYPAATGRHLRAFFRKRNVLIRPLGNTIYLMPPYCVTADDLDHAYDTIAEAAETVLAT